MTTLTEPSLLETGTVAEAQSGDTTTTSPSSSVSKFSGFVKLVAMRPMASLRRMWTDYYPRGAFAEEEVIMPGSALRFIIGALLSFVEIKSQGQPEFPFQTHPIAIMFAITCLLMYGLASGVQHLVSAAHPGPNSVYAVIARCGKMVCVYILVGSLASLFYF